MKNENSNDYVFVNGLPLPSRKTRKHIVIVTLLFSWIIIGYLILCGEPGNSLHSSALSWAYSSMIGIIFAYVFGSVTDNWNVLRNQGVSSSK